MVHGQNTSSSNSSPALSRNDPVGTVNWIFYGLSYRGQLAIRNIVSRWRDENRFPGLSENDLKRKAIRVAIADGSIIDHIADPLVRHHVIGMRRDDHVPNYLRSPSRRGTSSPIARSARSRPKTSASKKRAARERARNRPRNALGQFLSAPSIPVEATLRADDLRPPSPGRMENLAAEYNDANEYSLIGGSTPRSRSPSPRSRSGSRARPLRARDFMESVQEGSGTLVQPGTEPTGYTLGSTTVPATMGNTRSSHQRAPTPRLSMDDISSTTPGPRRSRSPSPGPAYGPHRNPFVPNPRPERGTQMSPATLAPQVVQTMRNGGRGAMAINAPRHLTLPLHVNDTLRYAHRKLFKAQKYGAPAQVVGRMRDAKIKMEEAISTWLQANWNSRW